MTVRGAELLREELKRLKSVDRPNVIKAIAEAREHGDLKENAEYHAAKEQQGFIEGRIQEVEAKLSNIQEIDVTTIDAKGKIVFGCTVEVLDVDSSEETVYKIVGEDEADLKAGKIHINWFHNYSETIVIDLKKELKELPGTKYQVITLWHVLEHLPELKENIGRLASLLKEEGTLIVAVPNYKSFDAKYYNAYWAAYDVPRHLWHFSRHSIQRLFQEHNLEVVETRPMWFDAFYVSLLSETYKKSKAKWIKAFFIGLWSNLRGLVTKEYSSHIYILKKAN